MARRFQGGLGVDPPAVHELNPARSSLFGPSGTAGHYPQHLDDGRPLHLRRQARRHRDRVRARRGDHGRGGRQPARADALPRRPSRLRPARRRPGIRPEAARGDRHVRRPPRRPADRSRPGDPRPRARPRRAGDGGAPAACGSRRAGQRQVPRARVLRGERHPLAAGLAAGRPSGRPRVPRPRQGAQGLRRAAHLPRGERGAARLLPALYAGGLVRPEGLQRRGVLDRRLLRPRRPAA